MRKIFLFLILISIFFLFLYSCTKKEKLNNFKYETIKVKTESFSLKKIPVNITIDGFVSSDKIAYITPKIDGFIEKINVNSGDKVKKGQLLVLIKNREIEEKVKSLQFKLQSLNIQKKQVKILVDLYKKSLSQAKANFILAKKNFNRYKNLLKSESITKEEFDKIHTQYVNTKLEVEKARDLLKVNILKLAQINREINSLQRSLESLKIVSSYRIVKSPFSGIILEKYLDVGNLVKPGVKILKLGSFEKVAYFTVPSKYINFLKAGDNILINNTKKAKIIEIIPDIKDSQFKIKVLLNKNSFFNGEYIKAKFTAGTKKGIVLPENLVKKFNDIYYTYVCTNGFVVKTFLTGKFISSGFLVNSGLSEKDKVILNPIENFQKNLKCESR